MKKNFYMIIMVLAITTILLISSNLIIKNQKAKNYIASLDKINYRANITYFLTENNENTIEKIEYIFKNNIEQYLYEGNTYKYMDIKNKKKYVINTQNKYVEVKKDEESNKEKINKLLTNNKIKSFKKNIITLDIEKHKVADFINSYKSKVVYNPNEEYTVTLAIKDNNISELMIYVNDSKFIKYTFTNINQIPDIELPEVEKTAE